MLYVFVLFFFFFFFFVCQAANFFLLSSRPIFLKNLRNKQQVLPPLKPKDLSCGKEKIWQEWKLGKKLVRGMWHGW